MTLTDYKSLFIYTHLYLQALIQVSSVTIQWNPGSFHWILVPFHWNPVESGRMDAFLQESVGHQKVQPSGAGAAANTPTVPAKPAEGEPGPSRST